MYFPIGWPKVIKIPDLGQSQLKRVVCDRDKILFAILTDDSLSIWFAKPCVPIVFHRRTPESLHKFGVNLTVEWKPDSSKIVIATSEGHLIFYNLDVISDQKGLYIQTDSPYASLRRDSAELFIKEIIPPLHLALSEEITVWDGQITSLVCITMTEIMVATTRGHVLRYRWDGQQNRDYNLDLRRIPFCINQQVSRAIPIVEENTYITSMQYSPLIGGFAIVLNDGRAAFLTASTLKFDPNQVQGIWAQNVEDATCTSVNHKYRLITFGRANAECVVYYVDESTGGLEVSHCCVLSSKDYPGYPGSVTEVSWTPDGCALIAAWSKGGIAMWSTFGALLMCSLGWDYGLNVDIQRNNPLHVKSMEWSVEGYQLWMIRKQYRIDENSKDANANPVDLEVNDEGSLKNYDTSLIQLDFVKSSLTNNPCMSHQSHLYLQGDEKIYVNSADVLIKMFSDRTIKEDTVFSENSVSYLGTNTLAEGRQWLVVPVPSTYSATNWPVRYSAIDNDGQNIAIAGRTGLAHYSMLTRRWKLFGNETQEKDFIVAGGLLWWHDYIVLGCYSIIDNGDELRFYPKDSKLDNKFAKIVKVSAPILLVNSLQDQLITFGSDAQVSIWVLQKNDAYGDVKITKIQAVDISALCVHPACVVSVTLTALRTETGRGQQNVSESMVLNVSGRLLMVQRESKNGNRYTCSMPTVLASCVENVWVPGKRKVDKAHLTEALWLFCGSHGMRVWLPLYPRDGDKTHSFMSKRIMLPFHLRIYPLAILFEDAIILGAENDTVLYTTDANSPFSLPFSVLQRTSQVYLHQILRQLIRRNLGYHAWEIARSCTNLPYFPHALELLLHEVLEEEATSKEPIPDAQLPSVIEFIMEFPVYLQTVVQCARKTEIALWPYLFSVAGKPKDLFQECMLKRQLDTASSYLIILQNLETSSVSRHLATILLDTALEQFKWELAKDLVRFLRAIDPNDAESPRTSFTLQPKLGLTQQTAPVTPNAEDISLILGNVQGPRVRSYSTTVSPKIPEARVSGNINANTISESPNTKRKRSTTSTGTSNKVESKSGGNNGNSAGEFFIDVMLQRHARRLLSARRLVDLGYFAAHLDFHLVAWLGKERERVARIDDFVTALKQLHEDFSWPYPVASDVPGGSNGSDQPETPVEDRLKALHIDVPGKIETSSRIGDSGYTSLPGLPYTGLITPINTLELSSRIAETEASEISHLDIESQKDVYFNSTHTFEQQKSEKFQSKLNAYSPRGSFSVNLERSSSIKMGDAPARPHAPDESVLSTVSSVFGDDREFLSTSGSENWEVPSSQLLEQLSNAGKKGSHRSEVQLRYLLQLFMEAGCLEWTLLISVLLRDALAVLRTINAAKSADQSIEAVTRLRQGLQLLHYWTHTECLGYKSFMLAIQNQASVLSKILATKIQHQQIIQHQQAVSASLKKLVTPTPRSRKSSTNQDSSSQSGSNKDRVNSGSNSGDNKQRETEVGGNISDNAEEERIESTVLPESTGCSVS